MQDGRLIEADWVFGLGEFWREREEREGWYCVRVGMGLFWVVIEAIVCVIEECGWLV